jgi:NADH:ubiquinone oxidoreductase subunit 3 (subunit A)
MPASYLPVLVFFAGGFLFAGLGYGLSRLLQKQNPVPEKLLFYECGEEPTLLRSKFQLRYFLSAMVFVLMEVELVLMAPVILNRKGLDGISASLSRNLLRTEMLVFIALLIAGFLLALGLRYFQWKKPAAISPAFEGPVPDSLYLQYNQDLERGEVQGR